MPSGPSATWSIQRRLASVATTSWLRVGAGRDHRAVVAAGDDALAVARRRENAAAMHRDALGLAVARHEQQRLLAEHEHRHVAEKIRGDHRAAGREQPGALGDRGPLGRHDHVRAVVMCVPLARSRHAFGKALADHALRQLAADEHEPAFALLGVLPVALVVAVEHHVHALEHEALRDRP